MPSATDLVAGDTGTLLRVPITNRQDESAIDLTGAVVTLYWRIDGGSLQTRTMTVQTPADGIAEYQFATGDLVLAAGATYGTLRAEVEVTDAGGKKLTGLDPIALTIRARV